MKKIFSLILSLAFSAALLAGCGPAASSGLPQAESQPASASAAQSLPESQSKPAGEAVRVAGLKGPTTMGMVKLMEKAQAGETAYDYQVSVYGTPDEVNGMLINGDLDIAALPANVASVLYNKTGGEIQVAAINTLGVLYVVETGDTIHSVEDLRGRTVYSSGKGATPEIAFNYILRSNGLDPDKDLTVEYKSEATELAVVLAEQQDAIAVLPQPYVTAVQMQNEKVRTALSFSEEWDKVSPESGMVTGVLVVRREFAEKNPEVFADFMKEYSASIEFVNANQEAAAELVAQFGIVEKAPVALKALPASNIVFIEGAEMKTMLSGYLQVLYEAKPETVGGKMPEADFYFGA